MSDAYLVVSPFKFPIIGLSACAGTPDPEPEIPPFLLDAGAEELALQGVQPMTLSDGGITASYVLQGGLETASGYGAAPAGFTAGASQVFTAEAGIVGFEWHINAPEIVSGPVDDGGGYVNFYEFTLMIVSGDGDNFAMNLGSRNGDDGVSLGGNHVLLKRSGVTVFSDENRPAMPEKISVDIDKDAGVLRIHVDDVPLALSADSIIGTQFFTAILLSEGPALDAAYIGSTISATIVEHAADMTGTHTAGAVDRRGVVI